MRALSNGANLAEDNSVTENKKTWRTSGALIAAATAGAFGVGLFASPAQAHTPEWEVTCSQVSLDLTNYGSKADNTVNVTVDGKDLLPTETFQREFHKKLELPEHSKESTVRLVVKAGDGDQYSRDEKKTAPVCEGAPKPSVSPKPTPSASSPSSAATPSSAPSAAATSAAAVPVPSSKPGADSGDLAETGSSSATPVIAGAAAVVIVAGAGLVWATRRRRGSAQG